MGQLHATFEMPRCHAHKRHPVAMLGVHIGLHLKNESCNLGLFWGKVARLGFLNLWLRTKFSNPVHQFLDPEGIDRRAEPDRSQISLQQCLRVKWWHQRAHHFHFFAQFVQQMCGHMLVELRVIQPVNLNRGCDFIAVCAIHKFQLVKQQVITPHKIGSRANWPACWGHIYRQIFLYFVDDLECVAAFAVHFIAKRQNWQIAQPADLKQLASLAFDPLGAINHHHCGIDCGQRAVGVFGKI